MYGIRVHMQRHKGGVLGGELMTLSRYPIVMVRRSADKRSANGEVRELESRKSRVGSLAAARPTSHHIGLRAALLLCSMATSSRARVLATSASAALKGPW